MTELILVRHGETEWNATEIFRGRKDVALNATGIRQAELLAGYLKDRKIEAVYASPVKRAMETAQKIALAHNIEVIPAAGLIDMDFGKWEGLSRTEVKKRFPDVYSDWINHPVKVKMPGGERLYDVRERALTSVKDITAMHKGSVVLVSHRVVLKVLICALLGLDNSHFWNLRIDNGAITTFDFDESGPVLVEQNNTSFLKPLLAEKLVDF